MTMQRTWSGPTLRELRAEGPPISARRALQNWKNQQRREAAGERRWRLDSPRIGPRVWEGGDFRKFLARADDASIHVAFNNLERPLSPAERKLAQGELMYRQEERRGKMQENF